VVATPIPEPSRSAAAPARTAVRQLDMPRLREVLTARGYGDVRTHLRSGNVRFPRDRGGISYKE
jgi:Protein of unknown function (DUF1697)